MATVFKAIQSCGESFYRAYMNDFCVMTAIVKEVGGIDTVQVIWKISTTMQEYAELCNVILDRHKIGPMKYAE